MKIAFNSLAFLIVVLIFLPSQLEAADDGKRPNFIIFIADDMAWDDCGPYGHPHIQTPHIDRVAEEGLRFDTAWLTCSSCSPSRCSTLTGLYPHSTGAENLHDTLPKQKRLFTKQLREAGYHTAASGKWHLGPHAKQDFDEVLDSNTNPGGCGRWVEALQKRPKEKPFFLWLASTDPHRGYGPNTIDEPHSADDAVVPPYLPDAKAVRDDLGMYYDEITRFDQFVGKVLDELKQQGEADNTFVLIMSDNGRPFPRCKTTVYDSGVKTPFIVRYPRLVKPGATDSIVSSVDIAPTILELAGLNAPEQLQGRSFAPILKDHDAETRKYAFAEHNWHDYKAYERAARDQRFTYIRNWLPELPQTPPADAVRSPTYRLMQQLHAEDKLPPEQLGCFITPRPEEELYDTKADPHSLNNLAADPAYADDLKRLRKALDAWRERTEDFVPEKLKEDTFDRETGQRL